jgi:hypothetical protein
MDVLYYSNFCKYSKELLTVITRSSIKQKLYFICIDKRKQRNGSVYVGLENGKEVKLPDVLKTVPSVILFSRGNLVLEGNAIYKYIKEYERESQHVHQEPSAFSLNFESFTSDSFSFIDTSPEQMNAKGDGGALQMHNYVGIDSSDQIVTPPENYVSTRISQSEGNELDNLIKQRETDVPKINAPYQTI